MLTHIDQNNQPTMVEVTDKSFTVRMARAQTQIQLPESLRPYFKDQELHLNKGPVFQTAIVAGTMAVKKTHEVVPFCHQLPIEGCKFNITINENLLINVDCKVKTTFKTGVEMEALHGAMTAALVIYDMCKAVSHDIVIKETRLLEKTGGKKTILERPVYGLVLTGGKSSRMGMDKALLNYKGLPHAQYIHNTLRPFCEKVFISSQENQWTGTELEKTPAIIDQFENAGPMGGILSAFKEFPEVNWLVVACDLIHFNTSIIEKLLAHHNPQSVATCFANKDEGFPEALCALYTPAAKDILMDAFKSNVRCPVKVLKNTLCEIIKDESVDLSNINTKEELLKVQNEVH
jgi:cyclic pyranopterin monophosphate synthase